MSLSAERGWLVRNELGWMLPLTGALLYAGLDYGRVGGPSSQFLLGTSLTGAVVGLRAGWRGLSLDAFVGQPVNKPQGYPTSATTAGFSLAWQT